MYTIRGSFLSVDDDDCDIGYLLDSLSPLVRGLLDSYGDYDPGEFKCSKDVIITRGIIRMPNGEKYKGQWNKKTN